ncbi:helix-turn-helix domain-containing protein [Amycolatopsis sp. NPDC059657]|uniref:AraC family transcriptional regulator n=1 Tax=Amycolatopsis sp. NPDC059657 TaxID=3346899 RepID=UPI003671681F
MKGIWGNGIPVPAALRPWISDIRQAMHADQRILTHPPDPATALVFRATPGEPGRWLVAGPRTHARYNQGKRIPFGLRIRIRPGRAQLLLGASASELVDQVVPLSELWGTEPDSGPDPSSLLAGIEAELLARLAVRTARDVTRSDLVRAAIKDLPAPVHTIARRFQVSERHLRDLFTENVGVAPKRLVRINRVRTVLTHARERSWSQLATDAGYFDQSHMTAEFRETMGVPPGAFLDGRLPEPAGC